MSFGDWFTGRDRAGSRSYDFGEARPVWNTWWFRIGAVVVAACVLWILWTGLR
jgi:hypothetical protein